MPALTRPFVIAAGIMLVTLAITIAAIRVGRTDLARALEQDDG